METFLLIPLEDAVVFPNMTITLPIDVGDEERVLLVPTHENEYAKVGVVAEVTERAKLPGGVIAVPADANAIRAALDAALSGRLPTYADEPAPYPDGPVAPRIIAALEAWTPPVPARKRFEKIPCAISY